MTAKTYEDLRARATQIKNATGGGENTASRVGGYLVDLLDSVPNVTNVIGLVGGNSSPSVAAANTAALQAAVSAGDGSLLVLPADEFYFAAGSIDPNVVCQITGRSNLIIAGAGVGATALRLINGADSNIFNVTGASSNIGIFGMELNGNRANVTPDIVHGVRGDAFSGLWLEDLYIREISHYGIGIEGFIQQYLFFSNIRIENVGGDGFDQKNKADANLYQVANNITVTNFGLTSGTQAGWDCRGAWQLTNFVAHFTSTSGSGFRIRNGETGTSPDGGFGGHRSHISNFEVYGPGTASTSSGIECVGRDVMFTNGYIRDVLFGVTCSYDIPTSQGAQRGVYTNVTCENYGTAGFITSSGATQNTFTDCTALGNGVGIYGFRIRSTDCTINTPRAQGNVTADISIDTGGTRTHMTQPRLVGSGSPGAAVTGIDVNADDCKCIGGESSGHVTNCTVTAARFKAVGTTFRAATTDNVLVAAAATDAEFVACTTTGAASEGLQVRGARTTWRGGEITSNGGVGVQTEASATDTLVADPYMTGNAADFDDQGSGTVVTRSRLVGSLVNQAVASGGTSSNIDTPILSSTTVLYLVEAVMEDSTGGTGLRCTQRTRIEVTREGSGTPAITGSASEFTAGSGLTVNSSITGNSLRVNVTKAASGTSCRMDIRVFELRRMKTVVFT